jgi:penicillin-binding protein 1A
VTFREALEHSLNVPFARIGIAVGPDRVVSMAQRLGIESRLNAVPSIALGSSEVTLLELVRAYGVLATGGELATTRTIVGRRDTGDVTQDEPAAAATRVADPAATFLVTSALEGAVLRGTGSTLNAGRFGGGIAGKTGTSNDWRDAWFIAYSPRIVVGVWVGHDDGTSLRASGSSAAVPIVGDFLANGNAAHGEQFPVPEGVEWRYTSTGDWGSCGEREYFLAGTAPPEGMCGFRSLVDGVRTEWDEFSRHLERLIRERFGREAQSRRRDRGRRQDR